MFDEKSFSGTVLLCFFNVFNLIRKAIRPKLKENYGFLSLFKAGTMSISNL